MDIIFFFLFCSQLILSSVSVVFDFNASPNDAAPVFPMWFPVDLMRMERVTCLWTSFVCCFLYYHNTD